MATFDKYKMQEKKTENKIFSGDYSREMWDSINDAKTIEDLQDALYFVCCCLQELEAKLDSGRMNDIIL